MSRRDPIKPHNLRNCPASSRAVVQSAIHQSLESRAAELLERHPQFRGRSNLVRIRCANGRLVLSGQLPSYYLKQLAQEAVRGVGDLEIENNIMVFGLPRSYAPAGHNKPNQGGKIRSRNLPR